MSSISVRPAAVLCLVAGVLGAVSGLVLAVWDPAVGTDRFSYPQDATAFTWTQVWFGVHHLGLLAGLLALRRSGALPATRPAVAGWWAATLGMALLAVTEVVAISGAEADVDSGTVGALGALYGLDTTLLGFGLLTAGVSIARAGAWQGWRRWLVAVMGAWVFVVMFPALALTPTDGARLAIGAWMLLFALLGVALLEAPARVPSPSGGSPAAASAGSPRDHR